MTAGMKTSEFWGKTVVQIIGLLAALGVFSGEEADTLIRAAGILAVPISEAFYAISRGLAKSK